METTTLSINNFDGFCLSQLELVCMILLDIIGVICLVYLVHEKCERLKRFDGGSAIYLSKSIDLNNVSLNSDKIIITDIDKKTKKLTISENQQKQSPTGKQEQDFQSIGGKDQEESVHNQQNQDKSNIMSEKTTNTTEILSQLEQQSGDVISESQKGV